MSVFFLSDVPHHEHDCEACTYLGSIEDRDMGTVDVYRSCDGSRHEYIARYGTMGDYCTVWANHPLEPFCKALEALFKAEKPQYGSYQYDKRIERFMEEERYREETRLERLKRA